MIITCHNNLQSTMNNKYLATYNKALVVMLEDGSSVVVVLCKEDDGLNQLLTPYQ